MRKHLVALVIFFGWMSGVAAAQTSSSAGALADAFVDAWNTHDSRAFGRLYADDADWVTVGGETHKGRVAVEGALAKEHASWARTTTLRLTDVAVRLIDSENAVVMFKKRPRTLGVGLALNPDQGLVHTTARTLLIVSPNTTPLKSDPDPELRFMHRRAQSPVNAPTTAWPVGDSTAATNH